MKKLLIKCSVIIPLLFMWDIMYRCENIYIKEIDFKLPIVMFFKLNMSLLFFWYACVPIRKYVKGNLAEIAYNILPAELVCMLLFIQYHFWIGGILGIVILVLSLYSLYQIERDQKRAKKERTKRTQKRIIARKCRAVVFIAFTVLLIPFIFTVDRYAMTTPTYTATPVESKEIITDTIAENKERNIVQMLEAEEEGEFVKKLKKDVWKELDLQEKLNVLGTIVRLESIYLGIEEQSLRVTSQCLDVLTRGAYASEEKNIYIDIQVLNTSECEEVIEVVLHEIFHSYERYCVEKVQINQDLYTMYENLYCFKQMGEWESNFKNYYDGVEEFERYYQQAVERDARGYAKVEIEVYKKYF